MRTEKKNGTVIDRVYIRERDREDFERLRAKDSPLCKCENKELFLLAMATGFYNGTKIELGEKKFGFVRIEYFNRKEKAIIYAVAIHDTGTIEVLHNKREVYSIAEEYATGGIKLLKDKAIGVDEFGSYFKRLEAELLEEIKKIDLY